MRSGSNSLQRKMSYVLPRILLALLSLLLISYKSDGQQQSPLWCIANDRSPAKALQDALDWSCGPGGANCTLIQVNQICYLPNTLKDHASYAFNNYYQRHKHQGGDCKFGGVGLTVKVDPSHGSCKFEYIP